MIHKKQLKNIGIEKLNELTRIDLDLYRTNLQFNPQIPLDISTDVVLKALLSYKQTGKFLTDTEVFKLVIKNLENDKKVRFKFEHYFEKCTGRMGVELATSSSGRIFKQVISENGLPTFYFAIELSKGEKDEHGIFVPNPNFEEHKNIIEKLQTCICIPEKQHWGVHRLCEQQVFEFAKNNGFYIGINDDFEKGKKDNLHLLKYKRSGIPRGKVFCDGQFSEKKDDNYGLDFWWCQGSPCMSKCETLHTADEWRLYTLLDFCEILGFNTDEKNKLGVFVPKGHYYQFVTHINLFNLLSSNLYCKQCDEILYPSETGNFVVNQVNKFYCNNFCCNPMTKCTDCNCKKNASEIYLNHCLGKECKNIIDSRESMQCEHELYICPSCGTCCSHQMFQRRLTALHSSLKLDTPEKINYYNKAKYKVDNKIGHLERGEYFCHKCNIKMKEEPTECWICTTKDCGVKYDYSKRKWPIQRPHSHLVKKK